MPLPSSPHLLDRKKNLGLKIGKREEKTKHRPKEEVEKLQKLNKILI